MPRLPKKAKQELLKLPVTQSGGNTYPGDLGQYPPGQLCRNRSIVVYEYQQGRAHQIPLEFYKDYKGVLVTDGLAQFKRNSRNNINIVKLGKTVSRLSFLV